MIRVSPARHRFLRRLPTTLGPLLVAALASVALPAFGQAATRSAPVFLPRSSSQSGQFVVFAQDSLMRGALCNYAEEVRRRAGSVLGWNQGWRFPVSITMRDDGAANRERTSARLTVRSMHPDVIFQIEVALGRDFNPDQIRSEIVAALLMERAASRSAAPVAGAFDIPAWLVEGACGLMDLRIGSAAMPGFAALFQSNQVPDLREFLRLDPKELDTASTKLYRGFSSCLLKLLLGLPGGSRSLDSYLSSLPGGKVNSLRALLAFFPGLGGTEAAAQKWWKLGVASLATRGKSPFLRPLETDAELDKLLLVTIPNERKPKKPRKDDAHSGEQESESSQFVLSDYAKFARNKSRKAPLESLIASLNTLAARSHPLLQPVVTAYAGIAGKLIEGETKGLDREFGKLEALREQTLKRTDEIEDYMNWYEATSIDVRSDAFEGYFRTLRDLDREEQRREDTISTYLDRIQYEVR